MIKEIKDDSLLPKICNLENDLFNNDKYNKKQFDEMLHNCKYKIFAYVNIKLLGYIIIYDNIDYYEVFKIGVNKNYQNNGIGSQLINFVKNLNYVNKLYLEVNSTNLVAISFYKKNGFRQNGLRKNYYGQGEDGVLMEWSSDF